jgi:hypothetical protein
MLFCHIVDDFYLQGKLAQMKQRDWWGENIPSSLAWKDRLKYLKDYKMALGIHAFSWAFMMQLSIMFCMFWKNQFGLYMLVYVILFLMNSLIHFYVDNLKANSYKINLIFDQSIHIVQVFITWFVFYIFMKIV